MLMRVLEAIGEAYVGTCLAGLTIVGLVAYSKRSLLRSVKAARRR